jgi:putative DNA primase/helicase
MLVGEGANGKSTLINVIKALLGKENCSAVSLQDIAINKFSAAELLGKMVNLHPDLKADKIKDGGYFKALVSGDRIKAERKYGQPFELENKAKLIFSANEIPETDDDSYAYFRRWVIVPFNRTFEGDNRDTNLLSKLTTPEELSGLLYWALICLRLLLKENGFGDTDIDDIRRQYQLGASRIEDFIKERCELGEDKQVRTAEFNNALSNYLKAKGSNYLDVREVGRKMASLNIEHKQRRVKGQQAWFYVGIGLKCNSVTGEIGTTLSNFSKVVQDNTESTVTTVTASKEVSA